MDQPIDKATLSNLFDSIGGDKEFFNELIETFFQDAPEQFAALHSSLTEGNAETFRRAAHSLKSNAASFGATGLTKMCKHLEDFGKNDDMNNAASTLAEAEEEFKKVKTALSNPFPS